MQRISKLFVLLILYKILSPQFVIKNVSFYFHYLRAESDCYQYFTGVSGTVESFNYGETILDNTLYTLCVRQEVGYCGIEWSQAAQTSPATFDLDQAAGNALVVSIFLRYLMNNS